MIEEEKIAAIIQAKLEGSISQDENEMLEKWLENPSNAENFKFYAEIWTGTSSVAAKQDNYVPNSSKAWMSIEDQIIVDHPKRRFKLAHLVAATVALLLTVFGANYLFNTSVSDNIQFTLQANEKDTLEFSDGSMAYLFGPCTISYPDSFASDERMLSMDGLVYFDIAHDKTRSFEVNTEMGKVEVLGTSFVVDTRQKDKFAVQCLSGKVKMTAIDKGNQFESILTRNLMATHTRNAKELKVRSFGIEELNIAIPSRTVVFNNQPLSEIIERIEYDFGVSILLENKDLLSTKYTTSLNDSTLDDFLNELKIIFNVEVTRTEASTYILKGGNSN